MSEAFLPSPQHEAYVQEIVDQAVGQVYGVIFRDDNKLSAAEKRLCWHLVCQALLQSAVLDLRTDVLKEYLGRTVGNVATRQTDSKGN